MTAEITWQEAYDLMDEGKIVVLHYKDLDEVTSPIPKIEYAPALYIGQDQEGGYFCYVYVSSFSGSVPFSADSPSSYLRLPL